MVVDQIGDHHIAPILHLMAQHLAGGSKLRFELLIHATRLGDILDELILPDLWPIKLNKIENIIHYRTSNLWIT